MNPSEEVVLANTAAQLDIPSPNEDQLSVCLSVNSRKDSGIRSNSRWSSIQQQVLFHFSHAIVLILIFFYLVFIFILSYCLLLFCRFYFPCLLSYSPSFPFPFPTSSPFSSFTFCSNYASSSYIPPLSSYLHFYLLLFCLLRSLFILPSSSLLVSVYPLSLLIFFVFISDIFLNWKKTVSGNKYIRS